MFFRKFVDHGWKVSPIFHRGGKPMTAMYHSRLLEYGHMFEWIFLQKKLPTHTGTDIKKGYSLAFSTVCKFPVYRELGV